MPSLAVKCGATLALLAALGTLFTLQSQRYLGDRMPVGAVGGVATTGLAFMTMGVEHAAVWGVLAFLLDFIPCLGSIAFGWLWGITGLVPGMPVLLMVKTVCDRIDGLKPIGDLLGV